MGKIILLNGPPSSGKDTAARHIMELARIGQLMPNASTCLLDRMSMPIKRAFAGLVNYPINSNGVVDFFEERKEEIIPQLGISYRQWQIDFSERLMKPLYGENIFGRLIVPRITRRFTKGIADLLVIPDCGFQLEIQELYSAFDPKDILLVRCHRSGFTFQGDSRSYVRAPKGCAFAAGGRDTVEEHQNWIEEVVKTWLESPEKLPREE